MSVTTGISISYFPYRCKKTKKCFRESLCRLKITFRKKRENKKNRKKYVQILRKLIDLQKYFIIIIVETLKEHFYIA